MQPGWRYSTRRDEPRQDPLARTCMEDRYLGPELDLDALVQYPCGSFGGYIHTKFLKKLGDAPHLYTERESVDAETDYVTMRVRARRPCMPSEEGRPHHGQRAAVTSRSGLSLTVPTSEPPSGELRTI